jgi:hypothetical protein
MDSPFTFINLLIRFPLSFRLSIYYLWIIIIYPRLCAATTTYRYI